MHKQYKSISLPNRKLKNVSMIRSPAFKRKIHDEIPRINHKVIQFHNTYDIQLPDKLPKKHKGYEFWGCIVPPKKKITYKNNKPSSSPQRETLTRGETMFRKYIRRRPSLRLTAHTFFSNRPGSTLEPNFETLNREVTQKDEKQELKNIKNYKSLEQPEQNINQDSHETFLVTQNELRQINNKSVYKMDLRELKISIQWKKKFLTYHQSKMSQIKGHRKNNTLYNF